MRISPSTTLLFRALNTIVPVLATAAIASAATPQLVSRSALATLQDQGYALDDILTAESLTSVYDGDITTMLQAREAGSSWLDIMRDLKGGPTAYQTPTANEVTVLLQRGYGAQDIVTGDLMAHRFGMDIRAMLAVMPKGGKWIDLFNRLFADEPASFSPASPQQVAQALAEGQLPADLSRDELARMLGRGLTTKDINRAAGLSAKYSVPLDLAAAVKSPGVDWGVAEALLKRLTARK